MSRTFNVAVALATLTTTALGQLQFTDATSSAGLNYFHLPIFSPANPLQGGVTPGDFDRDGWVDLFIPSDGMQRARLFINQKNGTFADRAATWGLIHLYRGVGCNAADYDGDGWLDIFVTSMGDATGSPANGQHRLYHNDAGLGFSEVAPGAGVTTTAGISDGWGVAWGDYDLDGDLDLWVGGWFLTPGAAGAESLGTRLFENEGDGSFTDVTVAAGVFDPAVRGFGAVFVDQNGDRYPELLVAADFGTSQYFINNRDGTFTAHPWYLPNGDIVCAGMGTTIGDFDRDGDADWFVSAISPPWLGVGADGNRLYLNHGNHSFDPLPVSAGVNDGGWGWGAAADDFDHDGWTDLIHTNGMPFPDPITGADWSLDHTRLFMNTGSGTAFTEEAVATGITHNGLGRGLVTFDPDRDGDMDVLIMSHQGALQYFRNDLSGANTNWLQVSLDTSQNPALAPDGLGSRVEVSDSSGAVQTEWMTGGSNYLSRSQLVAHFGLAAEANLPRVEVRWADGFRTTLYNVAANQAITVPAPLPYTVSPLVQGQVATFMTVGLIPGELAFYLYNLTGVTGPGFCFPEIGGLCLDLPFFALMTIVPVAADGTAGFSVPLPGGVTIPAIASQVVVVRGPGGKHSLKSNPVVSPIQ